MSTLVLVLPIAFVVMVILIGAFCIWKKKQVENERTGQDPTAIITKSRPESQSGDKKVKDNMTDDEGKDQGTPTAGHTDVDYKKQASNNNKADEII